MIDQRLLRENPNLIEEGLKSRGMNLDLGPLQKRRPNLKINLDAAVDRTEGFSGAELEQSVIEAMYFAFAEKRELLESDLILATSQLVPLSRTAREQLESLKVWASNGRARASSPKLF